MMLSFTASQYSNQCRYHGSRAPSTISVGRRRIGGRQINQLYIRGHKKAEKQSRVSANHVNWWRIVRKEQRSALLKTPGT